MSANTVSQKIVECYPQRNEFFSSQTINKFYIQNKDGVETFSEQQKLNLSLADLRQGNTKECSTGRRKVIQDGSSIDKGRNERGQ